MRVEIVHVPDTPFAVNSGEVTNPAEFVVSSADDTFPEKLPVGPELTELLMSNSTCIPAGAGPNVEPEQNRYADNG